MLWAILPAAAVVLPGTAIAQPADYRVTEATRACERLEMVHTSAENAKREFRLGCTVVPQGTEVRLIARKGDVAQVVFLHRRGLFTPLGPDERSRPERGLS